MGVDKSISAAFEEFMKTKDFKEIAAKKNSEGGKFRMMKTRYKRKTLDWLAMLNVLVMYGYEIELKRTSRGWAEERENI